MKRISSGVINSSRLTDVNGSKWRQPKLLAPLANYQTRREESAVDDLCFFNQKLNKRFYFFQFLLTVEVMNNASVV